MKGFVKLSLLTALVILFSCEKQDPTILCLDCIQYEPVESHFYIKFDPYGDGMFENPVVKVYQGNIEDSVLITTVTPDTNPVDLMLNINIKYSVTATYKYIGFEVIAFDSTIPRVKYKGTVCDKPCYLPYNNEVDLRVKYLP